MLEGWGCSLYTSVAYTRVFTVFDALWMLYLGFDEGLRFEQHFSSWQLSSCASAEHSLHWRGSHSFSCGVSPAQYIVQGNILLLVAFLIKVLAVLTVFSSRPLFWGYPGKLMSQRKRYNAS